MSISLPDIKELNLADAVKRLKAHHVRCCRLPARVRRESNLQGASDAIWQVEAPAESGRAYLSAADQRGRSAPNVDHLDDFRAAQEVEKSITSAPKRSAGIGAAKARRMG